MRLKILLVIFGLLIIGSGSYAAANTIFKPKPHKPPESIGFENLAKEATGSAKAQEDNPKDESKEEVKGTTQYNAPNNYQPSPTSEATTKELTQTIETIKKDETPPQLPEVPKPPANQEPSFSEEHLAGFWNLYNQIKTVGDQMIAIRSQIYDLEDEYYRVPAEERAKAVPLNVIEGRIAARQEKIYNEIQLLVVQYNRLYDQQVQQFAQLCSTYRDVVVYYKMTSSCM